MPSLPVVCAEAPAGPAGFSVAAAGGKLGRNLLRDVAPAVESGDRRVVGRASR